MATIEEYMSMKAPNTSGVDFGKVVQALSGALPNQSYAFGMNIDDAQKEASLADKFTQQQYENAIHARQLAAKQDADLRSAAMTAASQARADKQLALSQESHKLNSEMHNLRKQLLNADIANIPLTQQAKELANRKAQQELEQAGIVVDVPGYGKMPANVASKFVHLDRNPYHTAIVDDLVRQGLPRTDAEMYAKDRGNLPKYWDNAGKEMRRRHTDPDSGLSTLPDPASAAKEQLEIFDEMQRLLGYSPEGRAWLMNNLLNNTQGTSNNTSSSSEEQSRYNETVSNIVKAILEAKQANKKK